MTRRARWRGANPPGSRARLLLGLIAAGCGVRVLLWLGSLGTNDIVRWELFATSLVEVGLSETYVRFQSDPLPFNHPPLMAVLAAWSLRISEATGLGFAMLFKLPSLVAELITAILLYRVWRERGDAESGLAAAAAYTLALSAILISSYHGNTDAIYFGLVFLAAYLMEEKKTPFGAGLAMGAALNVKLIPIVVALPLASRRLRVRDVGRFTLGGAMGALPFLGAYVSFGPDARHAFGTAIFSYRSYRETWGVELAVRVIRAVVDTFSEVPGYIVRILGNLHASYGAELLLVATAIFALWHFTRSRRAGRARFDAYELVALSFLLFLLGTPGFGVQYVGCVVAPLIATDIRRGAVVATVTGVFIGTAYAYFVVDWSPIRSDHGPMPAWMMPLSLAAWLALLWAGRDLLKRSAEGWNGTSSRSGRPG